MKAVTVAPGTAGSARLDEVPEPDAIPGLVVVEALIGRPPARLELAGPGWPAW